MPDDAGHPTQDEMDFGAIIAALSDPHRRRVVMELLDVPEGTERTCASFALPVSKSSNTYHFRLLRESGLVKYVDYGNRCSVTLRRADLDDRFPGLLALLTSEAGRDSRR